MAPAAVSAKHERTRRFTKLLDKPEPGTVASGDSGKLTE